MSWGRAAPWRFARKCSRPRPRRVLAERGGRFGAYSARSPLLGADFAEEIALNEADERWKRWLAEGSFLDGPAPATPVDAARVALAAPVSDLRHVVARATLEYEGFEFNTFADGSEQASYPLRPDAAGLWGWSARTCWELAGGLVATRALSDSLAGELGSELTPGQVRAFAHFESARGAFEAGAFLVAFAELRHGMAIKGEVLGQMAEWRFCFLLGLLRLGFAGGQAALIELATADKAFAKAAKFAEVARPELAAQALAAAAFACLRQDLPGQALERLAAARDLGPLLPEALYLEALAHADLLDEEQASIALGEAVMRDRGYALRAMGDAERFGGVDAVAATLAALAHDLWQQTRPMVAATLELSRGHAQVDEGELALLEAYLEKGQGWPVYDVLFALGERAELHERLTAPPPPTTRRRARSRVGDGGVIEVDEPFRSHERYREKVVVKPATIFTKEQTGWVVNTREIVHMRRVQRRVLRRETVVGSQEEGVVAGIVMLAVEPTSYVMGSLADEEGRADDEGRREVIISRGFFLGETPVTQAQWQAVLGEPVSFFVGPDRPVEQVSWFDAVRFCNALSLLEGLPEAYHLLTGEARWLDPTGPGYRLPTEAEWELACRAGTTTAYATGDSLAPTQANFERRHGPASTPVGSFPPNPWGFHDMHGNVWEWCFDAYDAAGPPEQVDPVGQGEGASRAARGGSWASGAAACRSSARAQLGPWDRKSSVGFRLAMTRPPDPEKP
ncbi:MAG: SUMF1/EgtB/PvdO family nonheme iron enzyme [Myxococcota bacterium]